MRVLRNSLLMLYCIFYSCKKENNSIPVGVIYHRTVKQESELRVFTSAGEIKNQAILNRFKETDDQGMSNTSNHLGSLDTIHILDNNNARLFENFAYTDFTYSHNSGNYNFSSKDTFNGYSSGDVYSKTLSYFICLYKPVIYSEFIVSSTAGFYLFGYKGRREHFMQKDKERLIEPWIVYNDHYKMGMLSYALPNKLDQKFYKAIPVGDTIVLREYSIVYE